MTLTQSTVIKAIAYDETRKKSSIVAEFSYQIDTEKINAVNLNNYIRPIKKNKIDSNQQEIKKTKEDFLKECGLATPRKNWVIQVKEIVIGSTLNFDEIELEKLADKDYLEKNEIKLTDFNNLNEKRFSTPNDDTCAMIVYSEDKNYEKLTDAKDKVNARSAYYLYKFKVVE